MRTHACGRSLSCSVPRVATIGDGASKHVVRQRIRSSPGAGVVCVGFVVTEVGVAVIVRVQSAELSSVQRFVLRLIGDWGAGSERIGGIALLGCPLPRPRRRSTTTADLLIWTPYGCTLVVLADFGSVQHGVLDTPPAGRWQVGERAADLRTGAGAVNPLQRARRQRTELTTIFRRAGVPEQIDVLVVLIPKTGSRITWTRPPQEAGEETIMARIGQSTGFTEYFQRSPDRPVCVRATDIAQAFAALGVALSAPDPEELAAEGFVMTAADALIGTPAPADSAGRLWTTRLPLFGGSRRRAAQPDIAFPGPVVGGAFERAEYAGAAPGSGTAGILEKRAPHDTAPNAPADREPASGRPDALPDASGGRPRMGMAFVPRQDHSDASAGEFDTTGFDGPDTDADVERSGSAEQPLSASDDRPGRGPQQSDPWSGATSTAERPLPMDRISDHTPGPGVSAAADTRSGRQAGMVRVRGLRGLLTRTTAGGAESALRPGVRGVPAREEDSPVSAGKSRIGGETARPGVTSGGPAERPATRTPGRGGRSATRVAVGVRRHQVPGTEAGRSREKAGGGRGARYAAALGAAGAVLALVAGTVFAASGFARFEVAEYGALCHNRGGTTVAAPYAAAGPSPVHLAGELSEITTFGPSAVWHPVDARSVQLVACISEGRLGELVRTCQYPPAPGHPVGRTLNLFAMAYRLSVYEARTGNRLAAIDLTGEQFADDPAVTESDECRAATGAPEEGLPGRRHSRLSHQQIQRALAPFVTPAAPHIQAAR